MRQSIRIQTFETNSSSYHTLAITKISDKKLDKQKDIIKGEDLTIDTRIKYKTIGDTESYSYVAENAYQRAQVILRMIATQFEDQFEEIVDETLYTNEKGYWDWDKKDALFKEHYYELPLVKAYVNAVKRYIGEDKSVTIEFNEKDEPFVDAIYDEGSPVDKLLGVDDLEDVDFVSDKLYDYIFSGDYEITEECESNGG